MKIQDNKMLMVPAALIKDHNLTHGEKDMYIVLGLVDEGSELDFDFLCQYLHRSKRTVQKYLRSLMKHGWVTYSSIKDQYTVHSSKQK